MTLVWERRKAIQSTAGPHFSPSLRRIIRTALLFLPAALFLALVIFCAITVIRMTFGEHNAEWTASTLANYASLYDAFYLHIFAKTVALAAASALLAVLVLVAPFRARTWSPALRVNTMINLIILLLTDRTGGKSSSPFVT